MNNSIPKIEMVPVRGDTFTMGYDRNWAAPSREHSPAPAHQVTLSNFSIGKYPVNEQIKHNKKVVDYPPPSPILIQA